MTDEHTPGTDPIPPEEPEQVTPDPAPVAGSESGHEPEQRAPESTPAEESEQTAPEPESKPDKPARPDRWLAVNGSAVLQAVATENYVCYGGANVPRYGVRVDPPPLPDPATLCAEMTLRAGPGDSAAVRLACLDMIFKRIEESERQVIWHWYDSDRRLQVLWVWDFFRLMSHVVARVGVPPESNDSPDSEIDPGWRTAVDAIRAVVPGDVIQVRVQSECGNINQMHPVVHAAAAWTPPQKDA